MNEPVKSGDWVLIVSDNYNSPSKWRITPDTICEVLDGNDGVLYARVLIGHPRGLSDDLGYYSYKKLDYPLLRLIKS